MTMIRLDRFHRGLFDRDLPRSLRFSLRHDPSPNRNALFDSLRLETFEKDVKDKSPEELAK